MGYRFLVMGCAFAVGAGAGCGSSGPAWHTWYSGSCDTRFEMPGLPVSQRHIQQVPFEELSLTLHGIENADTKYVYACRQVMLSTWNTKTDIDIASEVADVEVTGFDQAAWKAADKRPRADNVMAVTLTDAKKRDAEIRVFTDRAERLVHSTLTIGVTTEIARRFVEAIMVRQREKKPIEVRSAECWSSVMMPGSPVGTFSNGAVTHAYSEPGTGRVFQSRCIFMPDDLRKQTPAEIFTRSQADTESDGTLVAQGHRDIEVQGRYGRDLVYHTKDGVSQLLVRVLIDGERLQIATFKGPIGDDAAGKSFLGSFKLLAPKP